VALVSVVDHVTGLEGFKDVQDREMENKKGLSHFRIDPVRRKCENPFLFSILDILESL